MKRGFSAPDNSDIQELKSFEQENLGTSVSIQADEANTSTSIDTALFKKRSPNLSRLPVFNYQNDILYLLEQKPTLILSGETGSGKSTLVPSMLLKSYSRVLVIEPRRLAAITLAKRVEKSHEKGVVGYGVRFDHQFDQNSRLVFVTDGVFLNMLMTDPLLDDWDIIVVDECHERTISLDVCIGLLLKIQAKRKSKNVLKTVIMSATFDISNFVSFYGEDNCSVLNIAGREHVVDVFYLQQACPDYIKASIQTVEDICREGVPGDILIFLTSSIEIEDCINRIRDQKLDEKLKLYVTPLYSTLPANVQLKSIEPMTSRHLRRVVVSTNIAETSLTIPGVQYIIDCGFVRRRFFSPLDNIEAVVTVQCSVSECLQRTGRAGRERPGGKCYRLWHEKSESLELFKPTEIERLDLTGAIVTLGSLGISNYVTFPWLVPGPNPKILASAVEALYAVGILDKAGMLTEPRGVLCAEILTRIGGPGSGRRGMQHATLLLNGCEKGVGLHCAKIVALLSVKKIFTIPRARRFEALKQHKNFHTREGDLLSLVNVFDAYRKHKSSASFLHKYYLHQAGVEQAMIIYDRLVKTLKSLKVLTNQGKCENSELGDMLPEEEGEKILEAIASAYFINSAYLHHDWSLDIKFNRNPRLLKKVAI